MADGDDKRGHEGSIRGNFGDIHEEVLRAVVLPLSQRLKRLYEIRGYVAAKRHTKLRQLEPLVESCIRDAEAKAAARAEARAATAVPAKATPKVEANATTEVEARIVRVVEMTSRLLVHAFLFVALVLGLLAGITGLVHWPATNASQPSDRAPTPGPCP